MEGEGETPLCLSVFLSLFLFFSVALWLIPKKNKERFFNLSFRRLALLG